ncbi:MAG: FAD-dependent oxidoreductase [Planctomycetes bacterium]|nr:FAD-dependent oxidoreductase [Planctomycetota bacterium]
MKIAIVGTGIAGLVAARRLHAEHEITVFEAADRLGGHTHTVPVRDGAETTAVDTGFIVFNKRTYPGFTALLDELGVAYGPSPMSFSVRDDRTGLEYNGTSIDGLFAQRGNLLRPGFWRMLRDILRFYREAPAVLARAEGDEETLGAYLDRNRYSRQFVEQHMLPMGAAVWSSRPDHMREFPLRFLVQFFHNHGFLAVNDRPQWLVVRGGSSSYLEPLTRPFRDRIRLSTPVQSIEPGPLHVRLRTAGGKEAVFDRVVLACHADTSLRLLADPTPLERELLGSFEFQRNEVVLHSDASLMPRCKRAWASWNYHVTEPRSELPTVTYWMNHLQGLPGSTQYFVTLNRTRDIAPDKVLREFVYHHPVYSPRALRAQRRHAEIDGLRGVHYCGAYWGYGFHEDGLRSAQAVLPRIRARAPAAQLEAIA